MVGFLPTNPVQAAALAIDLMPRDMPVAALRDACTLVLTRGHELPCDDAKFIAKARRLADSIDRGQLA